MGAVRRACGGTEREATKALVRRFVEEGVNQGKLEIVDEVLASTFPSLLPDREGPASVKQVLTAYRAAIPDAHWIIEEQVAEGEIVVTCFVARGTQLGPLWGVPATGRRMAVAGIVISHCREEKIVDQRIHLDLLGLLQQLGVMPDLGLEEEVIVARLLRERQGWAT
jgi:predicted ester cyclase